MNTQHWSVMTNPNGITHLLAGDGTILGTFTDWQVAEKILDMRNEIISLNETIEAMEFKCEEYDDEVKLSKQEIKDLEERSEHDHRTILDLKKEIDDLKTQLWNATHS